MILPVGPSHALETITRSHHTVALVPHRTFTGSTDLRTGPFPQYGSAPHGRSAHGCLDWGCWEVRGRLSPHPQVQMSGQGGAQEQFQFQTEVLFTVLLSG